MPKLLWACPWALHDTSSGAAIQSRAMLEKLAERGVEVGAVCSLLCDGQAGFDVFMGRTGLGKAVDGPERLFRFADRGVQYVYTRSASWDARLQTREEQSAFFSAYHGLLDSFRPDVVMSYGGDCLDLAIKAEAKLRGLPVVAALYNVNYVHCRFGYTDMIITDSQATATLYAKHRIHALPLGLFMHPNQVLAVERKPSYIVCVNPNPSKGAALFVRLALMAEKERPDLRFLLVQGRSDPAEDFALLHAADAPEAHPLVGRTFTNITFVPHTSDMRPVYAAGSVLLTPSIWYESFGRVAAEAQLNGMPVLASDSGGLPENVGEGGICLPVPSLTREDWLRIPTEEEMRPWFDALQRLHDARPEWAAKALASASKHDVERNTDRLLATLEPLFARCAGSMAHVLDSSCYS